MLTIYFGVPLFDIIYSSLVYYRFKNIKYACIFGLSFPLFALFDIRFYADFIAHARSTLSSFKLLTMSSNQQHIFINQRNITYQNVLNIANKYHVQTLNDTNNTVSDEEFGYYKYNEHRSFFRVLVKRILKRQQKDYNECLRLYDVPFDLFHHS